MDRAELERLDRESLVLRAQAAGIKRARVLTRPELIDELVRLDPQIDPSQLKRTRGFFGIARDLLSRVVERGLHLPDAAERFRAFVDPVPQVPRPEPQAIPTVTLAEIYAAQGHKQRAIDTLERVLEAEPDHVAARALLEKLRGKDWVPPQEPLPEEEEPLDEELEDDIPAPRESGISMVSDQHEEEEEDEEAAIPTPERISGEVASVPDLAAFEAPISEEPITEMPATGLPPTVDRCVAIGAYVWWQLSSASQRLAEESFFFVRIVAIEPSWDGPRVTSRDLTADPQEGELVLRDLPENAVIRVAIGFMPDGEFIPVAHSPALELDAEGEVTEWTLDPADATVLDEPFVRAAIDRAMHV